MGGTVKRWQAPVACTLVALTLLILVAPPLLTTLRAAMHASSQTWAALFEPRLAALLCNSIWVAASTTTLSILFGAPLGLLLARTRLSFVGVALFLHALPLMIPPFITALSFFHLIGRGGWFGLSSTPTWLFAMPGCVLVLTISLSPVITVLTWLGARGMDASGDEAARIVAGPWRTLWRIVLPTAMPSIALAAIVVFSLTLIEVAVPMFLRVDVYSAAVFARLGGFAFEPGEAAALALPLMTFSLILWILERAIPAHRVLPLSSARISGVQLFDRRGPKTSVAVAGALASLIGMMPLIVMAAVAFKGSGFSQFASYGSHAAVNSIVYAAGVSTVVAAIAIVVISVAREYPRFMASQDAVAWLAFLLPPALFSIGAIGFWNRPAFQWLYDSAGIVMLALAARYAVLGIRVELSGLRQLSPSLDEAARTFGATYLQRLLRIQLPALRRFSGGAWVLVFVFCLRDIETTALLYPAGGEPLTVRLFTLEANGPPAAVAALTVVLAVMTIIPLAAALPALRR